MLPTPQQLALRSQAPIHIFEKSEVPKDVGELYPGQVVLTFEKSEVPGEALFRLAAQLLDVLDQGRPDFAHRYEGDRKREAIFRLGSQLWRIVAPKCPHLFVGSRVAWRIVDPRVAQPKEENPSLLTYPELKSKKGIDFTPQHINRLEDDGKFPRHFKLNPGGRGKNFWWEHQIDEWMSAAAAHNRKKV
jgi:prophage regulatory protein